MSNSLVVKAGELRWIEAIDELVEHLRSKGYKIEEPETEVKQCQPIEDEVKACEWWREGWKFFELCEWKNSKRPRFAWNGPVSVTVGNDLKDFIAYVVRLGDGGIERVGSPNKWTNDKGDIFPVPCKGSYKAELLGVIVENSD